MTATDRRIAGAPPGSTDTLCIDPDAISSGRDALRAILDLASGALASLRRLSPSAPAAMLTQLRGTGPSVAFRDVVAHIERDFPLDLIYPFEGSERVGGAVLRDSDLLSETPNALAKLRWEPGADDLPMHIHEHSDRFIIVLEGRGFFHVSSEAHTAFAGSSVRTVAARERDVFCFTRGVVHTFSTDADSMTLLSVQTPFIPFDDPRQYTLPKVRWTAAERLDERESRIALLGGGTRLV